MTAAKRVLCPNCLRHPTLKRDGSMRRHVVEPGGGLFDGAPNWCNGSDKTTQECREQGHVARDYAYFRQREAEHRAETAEEIYQVQTVTEKGHPDWYRVFDTLKSSWPSIVDGKRVYAGPDLAKAEQAARWLNQRLG